MNVVAVVSVEDGGGGDVRVEGGLDCRARVKLLVG